MLVNLDLEKASGISKLHDEIFDDSKTADRNFKHSIKYYSHISSVYLRCVEAFISITMTKSI